MRDGVLTVDMHHLAWGQVLKPKPQAKPREDCCGYIRWRDGGGLMIERKVR